MKINICALYMGFRTKTYLNRFLSQIEFDINLKRNSIRALSISSRSNWKSTEPKLS